MYTCVCWHNCIILQKNRLHNKYAHTRDCTGAHVNNSHDTSHLTSHHAFGGWPVARCACAIFQPPKPFSSTIENLEMSSFTLPSKENF